MKFQKHVDLIVHRVATLVSSPAWGPRKSCVGSMKHVLAHMTYFYLKPPSWPSPGSPGLPGLAGLPGLLPVALVNVDLACCNVH